MAKGKRTIRKSTPAERDEHRRQRDAEECPANRALAREKRTERLRLNDCVAALKARREAQGVTLIAMAERIGMEKGNLSRLENLEGQNPKISTLERYAAALGCRIEIAVVAE